MRPVDYPAEQVIRGPEAPDSHPIRTQVCVIGTGAGGAVAACELAEAGLDVVMLEEGPYLTAADYGSLTPLRSIKRLYRDLGLTFTRGTPGVLLAFGKVVGGSTVINSGSSLRLSEETFNLWKEGHGLPGLDWPTLSHCLDRVEEILHVTPTSEEHMGGHGRVMRAGTEALGLEGEAVARNVADCRGRGRCYLGCPENAKQAMNVSYVPRALRAGARLYTEVRATRITTASGRVTGVQAVTRSTPEGKARTLQVEVERVVLACGAVHSPVLLRKSGIARDNRHAGRHLRLHPASRVVAVFDEPVQGHLGAPQSYHVTGLLDAQLSPEGLFVPPGLMAPSVPGMGREHLERMKEYGHMAMIAYRVIDEGRGSVKREVLGRPEVRYEVSPGDVRKLEEALRVSSEIFFAAGARRVYLPLHGCPIAEDMDTLQRRLAEGLRPQDLELAAYHPHGTLRMGVDRATSVTGTDGAVHGVRGLHVADASLMPESPVVNPQITIMALATHVGRRVAAEMGRR